MLRVVLSIACLFSVAQGFSLSPKIAALSPSSPALSLKGLNALRHAPSRTFASKLSMCSPEASVSDSTEKEASEPQLPVVPKNEEEMLAFCAASVKAAFAEGVTRQKIRLLMPRGGELAATDEDWPGGIMELYGYCSPLTRNLIRKVSTNDMAPLLKEQRLDESGVDGTSLWIGQCKEAKDDVTAFCQPNTECMDYVKQVCKSAGPRLVFMTNPQWRETKDGYDLLGSKDGMLGQIGNFLGGTGGVRKEIESLGFKDIYLLQKYYVRGDDCQILKAYPYPNWTVHVTNDDGNVLFLGEQEDRPTYQDIEKLLEEKGVAAKWARDAGLAKQFSKDE